MVAVARVEGVGRERAAEKGRQRGGRGREGVAARGLAPRDERPRACEGAPQNVVGRQDGLVEVDLPVHQAPRQQNVLHGVGALRLDHDAACRAARARVHAQRLEDAVDAHDALGDAGVERVAPEVVQAVHVELARHEVPEERPPVGPVEDGQRDRERAAALGAARPAQAAVEARHEGAAHGLVVVRRGAVARGHELVLQRVRERPVPDVVQERRGERALDLVGGHDGAGLAQVVERVVHERHRPQPVLEARVDGAGEDQEAQAELADAPQALHLGTVHEGEQQPLRDAHEAVDGVAEEGGASGHGGGEERRAYVPRRVAVPGAYCRLRRPPARPGLAPSRPSERTLP